MKLLDYDKASRLMDKSGIDVILASSPPNVRYLADYWHSASDEYYLLWDTSVTHKTLAGIPKREADGPFLVAGASEKTNISILDPWIQERHFWGPGYYIQTWKEPNPDPGNPMDVAAEVLAEKGFAESCIAVEKRYLGVGYFERLASDRASINGKLFNWVGYSCCARRCRNALGQTLRYAWLFCLRGRGGFWLGCDFWCRVTIKG